MQKFLVEQPRSHGVDAHVWLEPWPEEQIKSSLPHPRHSVKDIDYSGGEQTLTLWLAEVVHGEGQVRVGRQVANLDRKFKFLVDLVRREQPSLNLGLVGLVVEEELANDHHLQTVVDVVHFVPLVL